MAEPCPHLLRPIKHIKSCCCRMFQVWPTSLSRVTAVEPSAAMSQLGKRLEAARRFAHPHAPLVSSLASGPTLQELSYDYCSNSTNIDHKHVSTCVYRAGCAQLQHACALPAKQLSGPLLGLKPACSALSCQPVLLLRVFFMWHVPAVHITGALAA